MEYQKFENGESQDSENFIIEETPKTFVMDASVCIKWFSSIKEEYAEKAIELRKDYYEKKVYLLAPDLLLYEVTNALSYNPRFSSENVKAAISSLNSMQIKFVKPLAQVLDLAIDIRFLKNISIYDAVYIALSRYIDMQFITADQKLYDRIKDYGNVILLADYR
jgi:predicted nucleic acid-binding protein